MDTLPVRDALVQAWNQIWPQLDAEFARDLSPGSSGCVLEQLLVTLHQVARAGFEAWLLQHDPSGATLEREGRILRFKSVQAKEFVTPLGPVTIARRLYQSDRGGPCFAPLDAAWGMVGHSATPEVRKAAAYLLGLMTAEEAEQTLGRLSRFRLGETSLKKLAGEFGEWVETHPEAVAEVRAAEAIPEGTRVVCVSLDGTNVRLNEPGPKPGRPPSGDTRDLEPTCFKNAMVGTVSCYGGTDATPPERLQTKSVARMPEDGSPTFRQDLEAEVASTLARCEPGVTKVLVIDAAHYLWRYVESQPLFADFEKVVDYYHAAEHLGTAAEALFGKGSQEAKDWAAKHRGTLLESDEGAARVVQAIDAETKTRRLPKWASKVVATQRQFFTNHGRRMTYASFHARGLPIGSGPVEAAGKVLVKQRMVRSGMRWSRRGGQHILHLRTLIKSDRWDAIWIRYSETALAA